MQHVIYSGDGTYNTHTKIVNYLVYLPALTAGNYEFITNKIYNMSCSQYPNTVLMFMRVVNGSNAGYKGCTDDPGVPVTFDISANNLINVDTNCTPLDYTKVIYVIIMHDDSLNLVNAISTCYCKAPVFSQCVQGNANVNNMPKQESIELFGEPFRKKYGKTFPEGMLNDLTLASI